MEIFTVSECIFFNPVLHVDQGQIWKKTLKCRGEGQKQEQVPLQMETQATMYYKYTKNLKLKV